MCFWATFISISLCGPENYEMCSSTFPTEILMLEVPQGTANILNISLFNCCQLKKKKSERPLRQDSAGKTDFPAVTLIWCLYHLDLVCGISLKFLNVSGCDPPKKFDGNNMQTFFKHMIGFYISVSKPWTTKTTMYWVEHLRRECRQNSFFFSHFQFFG